MCEVFEAVRAQLDDHTHGIAQAVLADFIDEGHLAAHLRRMRPIYKERRDVLMEALSRHVPSGRLGPAVAGMHATLHLPRSANDRALRERGVKAGLALMPLSRYSPALNGLLLGYTALTPAQIREGVRRLATLL
jgi:GntR family transcriptional regulator / MocR family aminotransferase